MLLSAYGFDVIGTAKNGEEAVEMYEKFSVKPDIIIMDHRMPIKNGIEASKEILQINKNAKIIFASADTTIKEIANSIGVFSFKEKPFDNQKLIRNIKKALEKEDHQIINHN
jgi:YesN/AraC family two-component response regulator